MSFESYLFFCSVAYLSEIRFLLKGAVGLRDLEGPAGLRVILGGGENLRAILFVAISHFLELIFG